MAHDDIDQIAASSRLSVHDPKSTNGLGNCSIAEHPRTMMSHTVGNDKMENLGHPNKGGTRPIILADKAKLLGNSGTSHANQHQQKRNDFDRIMVDVSNVVIK